MIFSSLPNTTAAVAKGGAGGGGEAEGGGEEEGGPVEFAHVCAPASVGVQVATQEGV